MASPYLGEVRMLGFDYAPRGWALCHGQLLPVDQHQALFSVLGTTYGGDGESTFGLPDLRGRVPLHPSAEVSLGHAAGVERVALTENQLPAHSHAVRANNTREQRVDLPSDQVLLARASGSIYQPKGNRAASQAPHADTVGGAGEGRAHENMQPYLVMNFCIALQGVFPPRP